MEATNTVNSSVLTGETGQPRLVALHAGEHRKFAALIVSGRRGRNSVAVLAGFRFIW